jgi:hypothetical protein
MGLRHVQAFGSPWPVGVADITNAPAGTIPGAAKAFRGRSANMAAAMAYRMTEPSERASDTIIPFRTGANGPRLESL